MEGGVWHVDSRNEIRGAKLAFTDGTDVKTDKTSRHDDGCCRKTCYARTPQNIWKDNTYLVSQVDCFLRSSIYGKEELVRL